MKKKTVPKKPAQKKNVAKPKTTIEKKPKKCFLNFKKNKFLVIGIIVLIILIIGIVVATKMIDKKPVPEINNNERIDANISVTPEVKEQMSSEEFLERYSSLEAKQAELNNKVRPAFYSKLSEYQEPLFKDIISAIGLNEEEQNICLSNNSLSNTELNLEGAEILAKIYTDTQVAQMVGLSGTPAVIVDGNMVGGYVTYDEFKASIESALVKTENAQDQLYSEEDSFYGNKDAKVVVYIYSDYYCGYCKKLAEESVLKIKTEYADTGKIKLVLKDFVGMDPSLAVFARCAEEQNKYLDAELKLFSNSSRFSEFLNLAQEKVLETHAQEIKEFEDELKILQTWSEENPEEFQKIMESFNNEELQ